MKILTLNTWQERGPWRERWRLIFKGLLRYRPDVVLFQEVFNAAWAEKIKLLSGYRYMVFPPQKGGLMMLFRYPVRDCDCITYKTKSKTEDYFRYAMFAKIRVGAQDIAVFNTHLSWRTPETEVRKKQIRELIGYINLKARHASVFAAGDFNADSNAREICLMAREGRFTDLYELRNPGRGGLTWNNKNPYAAGSSVLMANRRIDFIWMRDPKKIFKVRRAELVYERPHGGIYASDHFGVQAELVMSDSSEEVV